MNRDQRTRLAAIAEALPSISEIKEAELNAAKEQAYGRITAGTGTPSDFALLCDTTLNRRLILERAGDERHLFNRGWPSTDPVWKAAGLLVSWPLEEEPPPALYAQIESHANPADPSKRGSDDWIDANGLLALLGPNRGVALRREYHDNLEQYDPQWRVLRPEGRAPEQMVQRVEDGTADERDHFFTHLPYQRIYMNEFLVAAVGHRLARQRGEVIYITEPRLLAIELLSYFPDEKPPEDLWREICNESRLSPTAGTIEQWREYNRCLVVLGRWDGGERGRRFLAENWPLYEAEYRYLASRGEFP
jgi:hypothetical protein